jgi:hypothetical protein
LIKNFHFGLIMDLGEIEQFGTISACSRQPFYQSSDTE